VFCTVAVHHAFSFWFLGEVVGKDTTVRTIIHLSVDD
jgi:hypothetical protein